MCQHTLKKNLVILYKTFFQWGDGSLQTNQPTDLMSMWLTITSFHHSLNYLWLHKASNMVGWLLRRTKFQGLSREPFIDMMERSFLVHLFSMSRWLLQFISKREAMTRQNWVQQCNSLWGRAAFPCTMTCKIGKVSPRKMKMAIFEFEKQSGCR